MNSYLVYSTHCEYWKMADRRENGTALGKSECGTARPKSTAFDGRSSFYMTWKGTEKRELVVRQGQNRLERNIWPSLPSRTDI